MLGYDYLIKIDFEYENKYNESKNQIAGEREDPRVGFWCNVIQEYRGIRGKLIVKETERN